MTAWAAPGILWWLEGSGVLQLWRFVPPQFRTHSLRAWRFAGILESYSEDPEVVRSMTSIIDGLQGQCPTGWKGPVLQDRYEHHFNLFSTFGVTPLSSHSQPSENAHMALSP